MVSQLLETYEIDDFKKHLIIYADVGESITDIRRVRVVEVDEEKEKLGVVIGVNKIDGPYYITVDNVYGILADASA